MPEKTLQEIHGCVSVSPIFHPGDHNCGPHIAIYAVCGDGTIWVKYHSSPNNNVPTDNLWRKVS